jgi:5-methyltetrahydropteroyltriglutamate--homocysteine methyltransferase
MIRPTRLREARRRLRQGAISAADFKRIEDWAVDRALATQERAGIDLVTDGEQRRASFLGSLVETTEGLSRDLSITQPWHEDDQTVVELSLGLAVTDKLRRLRSLVCEEYAYARARTTKPLKVTLPSPLMLSLFWSPTLAGAHYKDAFELFVDGAEVIRAEISELVRMGCEHIQIDAPELAILIDPATRNQVFERHSQRFANSDLTAPKLREDGDEEIHSLARISRSCSIRDGGKLEGVCRGQCQTGNYRTRT